MLATKPFSGKECYLCIKFIEKAMTLIIVLIMLCGCLLVATSHLTNVNKAAVAMFVGTLGWVLYICYGTDFVMSQHPAEYLEFLDGSKPTSRAVKHFIYDNIFLKYVGKAAAIVLFLLATMTIVEILNSNGCFDFVSEWIRTRNSKRLLWSITFATFIISANLDNLTTTTMMLLIMRSIVQSRRQRMIVGCAIVLAANAGGCFTVIGDPAGVILWGDGAATASNFSAYLAAPAVLAWVVTTLLLSRDLPERLDVEWPTSPYRGDDTNLNRWQRIVMLIVGIGGLWFIPTFHSITKLSPFLGAMCVLSLLWIVNEIFNRKLMSADQMIQRRVPGALQYGNIQLMLFVIGVMLSMSVLCETGALPIMAHWIDNNVHDVWLLGAASGLLSGVLDSFAVMMAGIFMFPISETAQTAYEACFAENGAFWKVTAYSTAVGGCLLCFANPSGLALMKLERMRVGWYFRHCTPKVLAGWMVGLLALWAEYNVLQ